MPKKAKPVPKFKAKQLEFFWYWINERHRIYTLRKADKPWPWTKDKILQTYKFCNVFRQVDRVTEAWATRYAHLMGGVKTIKRIPDGDVLFYLCMFRLFNWPQTYDKLYYGIQAKWNKKRAIDLLDEMKKNGEQIFTGAYIVTSGGRSVPKHHVIIETLDAIFKARHVIAKYILKKRSMRKAAKVLTQFNTVGPFVAYEIVCDLRHTRILHDAKDIYTWANPGPGAKRGIHRLITGNHEWKKGEKPDYVACMNWLLKHKRLKPWTKKCAWPFEMREIEHSLCEYDKYMRVKMGQGKPRSKYDFKRQIEMPF